MIHPAKKPMSGGFSLDEFMKGSKAEDIDALAEALQEADDFESEFDSGITESDLMDRLREALDERDMLAAKLDIMEQSWREACKLAHYAEGHGLDVGYFEVLNIFNKMRMCFLKLEGKA